MMIRFKNMRSENLARFCHATLRGARWASENGYERMAEERMNLYYHARARLSERFHAAFLQWEKRWATDGIDADAGKYADFSEMLAHADGKRADGGWLGDE